MTVRSPVWRPCRASGILPGPGDSDLQGPQLRFGDPVQPHKGTLPCRDSALSGVPGQPCLIPRRASRTLAGFGDPAQPCLGTLPGPRHPAWDPAQGHRGTPGPALGSKSPPPHLRIQWLVSAGRPRGAQPVERPQPQQWSPGRGPAQLGDLTVGPGAQTPPVRAEAGGLCAGAIGPARLHSSAS